MAMDFTQDTVLHFLQSRGGSVKNSELLQHFRAFLREHPDRDRNRELFKKFVNSVATVQQVDGVSCVVLRKKYRGHVPGIGAAWERSRLHPAAEKSRRSPAAGGSDKPPPPQVIRQGEASEVVARKAVLPAAGIVLHNHNNNNVVNLKQQHVPVGPQATQLESPAQRSEVKTVKLSGSPPGFAAVARQNGYLEQHPVAAMPSSVKQHGGLESPARPEVTRRHFRHRQSYKAAVSYDEDDGDDDEEEESSQIRRGSAGGLAAQPLNAPLAGTRNALSASTPCITEPPPSPPPLFSSAAAAASPLSRKRVPHIYIQGTAGEVPSVPGSLPTGPTSPGSPLQAVRRCSPSSASPQQNLSPYLHPSGSPLGLGGSPTSSGGSAQLSSSHSSLLTPSPSPTSRGSPGPTSRGSPWNSSFEDLQARTAGGVESSLKIEEAPYRTQRLRVESAPRHANIRGAAHWYHSSDNLYQEPAARAARPWHHSTGNLQDDPSDGGSSDGPAYPLAQQQQQLQQRRVQGDRGGRRPSRVSSQLRSRMCRSMGADLDQLLQEEEESGRGHEAARLGRLALLSSSLSLGRHLSSSSLSSCHSLGELADEGPQGRRSFPPDSFTSSSPAHREHTSKQSLVPLEPREHAWLVKGAAGAWPDIYSLFREDPSLLNRQDFISGYTVLHWIAQHGDHRVLNTLWYGVEKAGLTLDVNARSTSGYTPLHLAAMHGHKSMLRLLVGKFQADVNRRDNAGKKPWQYLSSSKGSTSKEVWQLLGASPPSPSRRAGGRAGGGGVMVSKEQQRQRRRHHFSSASSGERPTVVQSSRVKRSTSLAAFLKHKTMQRFQGHQSDSSL